jgi:hypothetical protein
MCFYFASLKHDVSLKYCSFCEYTKKEVVSCKQKLYKIRGHRFQIWTQTSIWFSLSCHQTRRLSPLFLSPFWNFVRIRPLSQKRSEPAVIVIPSLWNVLWVLLNGTITYKPRLQQRRQRAQAHNSIPWLRQQSFMYWLCSKQKALLCTY